MDQTFIVRISDSVASDMLLWDIPPSVRDAINSRLRALSDDAESKLISVMDRWGRDMGCLMFTVPDPPSLDSTYLFMFHVEIDFNGGDYVNVVQADWEHQFPGMDDGTPVL